MSMVAGRCDKAFVQGLKLTAHEKKHLASFMRALQKIGA